MCHSKAMATWRIVFLWKTQCAQPEWCVVWIKTTSFQRKSFILLKTILVILNAFSHSKTGFVFVLTLALKLPACSFCLKRLQKQTALKSRHSRDWPRAPANHNNHFFQSIQYENQSHRLKCTISVDIFVTFSVAARWQLVPSSFKQPNDLLDFRSLFKSFVLIRSMQIWL